MEECTHKSASVWEPQSFQLDRRTSGCHAIQQGRGRHGRWESENNDKARMVHIRQEANSHLIRALEKNVWEHKLEDALKGDKIYYKRENEKRSPVKVIGIDGKIVIVKRQ